MIELQRKATGGWLKLAILSLPPYLDVNVFASIPYCYRARLSAAKGPWTEARCATP